MESQFQMQEELLELKNHAAFGDCHYSHRWGRDCPICRVVAQRDAQRDSKIAQWDPPK
jgi:hypothetical protein